MKYALLVAVVSALTLTACEYKKHPMDKPPPSAMTTRDSEPNFDELDNPSTDGGPSGSSSRSNDQHENHKPFLSY